MTQFFTRICKVCGEPFLAKRGDAEICNKNSSCRVKAHRQKLKAQKEIEKMILDQETYTLYMSVVSTYPATKAGLDELLRIHGKEPFTLMVVAIAYETWKGGN